MAKLRSAIEEEKQEAERLERRIPKEWDAEPNTKDEFQNNYELFYYFRKAELEGNISYPELEKAIKILSHPANRKIEIVKRLMNKTAVEGGKKSKRGSYYDWNTLEKEAEEIKARNPTLYRKSISALAQRIKSNTSYGYKHASTQHIKRKLKEVIK